MSMSNTIEWSTCWPHMSNPNSKYPFSCNVCWWKMNQKGNFRKHFMMTHESYLDSKYQFTCNNCGRKLTYKHNLRKHQMLIHRSYNLEVSIFYLFCTTATTYINSWIQYWLHLFTDCWCLYSPEENSMFSFWLFIMVVPSNTSR